MGGTQRMMVNFTNELSARKIPVCVYIYNYSYNQILEEQLDTTYLHIIKCRKKGFFKHFLRLILLIRTIRDHKINKIFSFSLQGTYLAILSRLLILSDISVIYRMVSVKKAVNHSVNSIRNGLNNFMFENYLLPSCDKVICQSNAMADDLEYFKQKKNENKIAVIHNFFDLQKVEAMAAQKIDLNTEFIIFIGRLSPEKNIFGIIDAYKLISNLHGEKLVIIGKGSLEVELKEYIKFNGLDEKIILLGNQINVYKYLAKAKCLILFSVFEGMPNVVLESMACRTAVIISDFTGHSDIVQNGVTGLVVAKNDVKTLSLKIQQMIENVQYRKKIEKNAYRFIVNFNKLSKVKYISLLN